MRSVKLRALEYAVARDVMQTAVVVAAGGHGDAAGVIQIAQSVVLIAAICAARDITHVDRSFPLFLVWTEIAKIIACDPP